MPLIYVLIALLVVFLVARLSHTYIPMPPALRAVVNIVLTLIVVGMVLWVINTYIPMAGGIKAILNVVVFLATCVGVLEALGLWSPKLRMWGDFKDHHPLR